jgi:hypothetical protein
MMGNRKSKVWWLTTWLVLEFVALCLALLSTGGGHGDYLFCKLLFPIPMYIGIVQQKIGVTSLILSLLQYPLVGTAPFLLSPGHARYFYLLFAVLNVIFVVMVFMHPSRQFG